MLNRLCGYVFFGATLLTPAFAQGVFRPAGVMSPLGLGQDCTPPQFTVIPSGGTIIRYKRLDSLGVPVKFEPFVTIRAIGPFYREALRYSENDAERFGALNYT